MTMMRVLTPKGVLEGEAVKPFFQAKNNTDPFWFDIVSPSEDDVRWLGESFGFHPLTLEDLLGVNNRPKLEEYGDYLFMVVRELIVEQQSVRDQRWVSQQGQRDVPVPGLKATELHMYLSERFLVTVRDEQQCAVDSVWRKVTANAHPPQANPSQNKGITRTLPPAPADPRDDQPDDDDTDPDTSAADFATNNRASEHLAEPEVKGSFTAQPRQSAVAKRLPAVATLTAAPSNGAQPKRSSRENPYEPQLSATNPFAHGLDFLVYNILDDVVDSYFDALEAVEDEIDALEDQVVERPHRGILESIFMLKSNLMILRKQTTPMREAVNNLITHNYSFIHEDNLIYFRDVYSLLVAVYEIVDTERDNAVSVLDAYLSSVNNNLSVIMKRLTGISVLFLPITAITGFAGMNLHSLPNEANWYNQIIYLLLIIIPFGMYYWFRKNDWL